MHVNVLYTFRSVSRAIPMVGGSGGSANKDALHMSTFKVRLGLESEGDDGLLQQCSALRDGNTMPQPAPCLRNAKSATAGHCCSAAWAVPVGGACVWYLCAIDMSSIEISTVHHTPAPGQIGDGNRVWIVTVAYSLMLYEMCDSAVAVTATSRHAACTE